MPRAASICGRNVLTSPIAHLANALSAQLIAAQARRAEQKPNPDSMDLTFQGWAWWYRGVTPDNLAEARRMLERALALDASNVWGLIGIALVDSAVALSFLVDDRAARFAAAEAAAVKALTLAPETAMAHLALGAVQTFTNRAAQGVRQCERALALDRNLAIAHATIGNGKISTRPGRRRRGSHPGGAAPQSPRHERIPLVFHCRVGQASPWKGGGGSRLAATLRRDQSELSRRSFLSGGCSGASRAPC